MKKNVDSHRRLFGFLAATLFIGMVIFLQRVPYTAQVLTTAVARLYDGVLSLPGCTKAGVSSCALLDRTTDSILKKTVKLERFVSGSGTLAFYFNDRSAPSGGAKGGFTPSQAYFQPSSGGVRVAAGGGLQVFERGTMLVEFDQPYTDSERFALENEFVFYYLPHTEAQRQLFLSDIQNDPKKFEDYKQRNKADISALCNALKGQSRIPSACPDAGSSSVSSGASSTVETSMTTTGSTYTTNPNALPELDFSGAPTRKPVVTVRDTERLVFVGEPVTVKVDEIDDPDGKCHFFQWTWQKSTELTTRDVTVDPRLGDISFTPLNEGSFTLTVRAKEACKELGTLVSSPVSIRMIVHDKSVAFSDLSGPYQNAIYDLYHIGVMKGYADGTMRPNAPIQRAEFLKMLFETLKYRIDDQIFSPRYGDVFPGQWFAPYVWQADVLGVIKGYPDGNFHPERTVNLVEALKMSMGFTTLEIKDSNLFSFPDVSNSDWYSRYVQTAMREGILDIDPGKEVHPQQFLTRGRAAQIIIRTLLFPVNRINVTNKDILRRPEEFQDFSSFTY